MSDSGDRQSSAPPAGGGPLLWEPPSVEDTARLFPNYEILRLVGRGGMGAVYKAKQVALDRLVAIKLLPLEVSANRDFADRFVREARTMAKLTHPNIISVHDFGTTSKGHLFFVMEFVPGANLHAIIHEVGLNPDQALWLAGEICAALKYAHSKGVVHRDIKPANVMVNSDSHVKVTDFGLARLTDVNPEMHGMTMTGMVMGTPDYMAPEQKRGMNVDARADLYSVGVMLYEMVCRELPQGAFTMPSQRTGCDPRLDAIVKKAMQPSREQRYQSAEEMEAALEVARRPMASALIPHPHTAVPHALAVAPRPGMPVAAPHAEAPVPRYAAPTAVTAQIVKSRTPLYAGIAAAVLAAIGVIVMALPKSKPEFARERIVPGENLPKEQTVAKPPEVQPTPASIAEKPKEPPVAKPPVAGGTRGAPDTPEPPKEQRVANAPEMKPAPAQQPAPAPPPADAPQQSATAKWLADQEPQWQAAFALEVTGAFDKGMADLRKQYVSSLDSYLASATRSGLLLEAVACRDEKQRMENGGAPGDDNATTPAGLKAMRAGFRKTLATLETDRAARAKAVHARYDSILAQNLTLLTQNQRLDEALLLKAKREELAALWLNPPTLPEAPKPQPAPSPPGMSFGNAQIAAAANERPFANSLGMKFVPVPIIGGPTGGQRVLFSIWETRVQDYEVFAKEKGVERRKPQFAQGPWHPVVNVSWDDAQAFCAWLTAHERQGGRLGATESYRLPSDHEWSCAVEIGDKEDPAKSPESKSGKIPDAFPWGTDWPPPAKSGNFKGEEAEKADTGNSARPMTGYHDGFAYTSPVGSFTPNRFGIYDLSGNVSELCEDLFRPSRERFRLQRGGCFADPARGGLMASHRIERPKDSGSIRVGFRVVLSTAGPAPNTLEAKVVPAGGVDVLPTMASPNQDGVVVTTKSIETRDTFTPPVAITYVLKTNNTVRLRYAADQIILNWESNKTELRIDGGPANRQYRKGQGAIPVDQFVTIQQVVLSDRMTISVDGAERASWTADFSKVKQTIGVFSVNGSRISLKQVVVKPAQ